MSDEAQTTNQMNKQAVEKGPKSSGSPPVGPVGCSIIAAYLILLWKKTNKGKPFHLISRPELPGML